MSREIATDLTVRRLGRADAEALTMVWLHGLTDSGSGWPSAERHWGATYAIVTLDQRGHGTSPRFTEEQLAGHPGEVMVTDAVAVLEQLASPVVLVGHSLGGAVALTVAVRRPDLVRALVLEDPAPLGPADPERVPHRGREFLEGVRDSMAAQDDADLLGLRRAKHPGWADDELLASGIAEQQMDVAYLAAGAFKPLTPWTELFAEVRVPTLVVSGDVDGDVVVTDEVEQGIARIANPAVGLVRIAGAEHCIRRDRPAAFFEAVDAFLSSLR